MLTPENIETPKADGSTCIVCDRPIDTPQYQHMVSVKLKVLLATIRKSAHIECAVELRDLIDLRISEVKVKSL